MSYQYDIPGVGFIANHLIGDDVKNAIGEKIQQGFAALDAGDELGATQAFSQATAVVLVAVATTIYMATEVSVIKGLGPVFQSLSNNKGLAANLIEKYVTPAFPQFFHPTEIAKLTNWGTSTAAGYSIAWWTNEFINYTNSLNLGVRFYDMMHPSQSVNTHFTAAANWTQPRYDPLTLDLDGDGLETLGINPTTPILFDHNGDGIKSATGWVKADDGFLVLDRNGNGLIDSGRELFGIPRR